MVTIINATNLLGDSLYSLQPIKQYLDEHPDEVTILVADRGIAYQMFMDTFSHLLFDNIDKAIASCKPGEDIKVINLNAGASGHICFTSAQTTGRQLHISEGYAQMLGLTFKGPVLPYAPWNAWEHKEDKVTRIAIAPFSRSCSRHTGETPNKTLDDWKWNPLQAYLRSHCDEFRVIGGLKDRLTNCPISEEEYWTASSFEDLRKKLKSLSVLVTVDNGLGHLSSVLQVPTIILWPQVSSMEFIGPATYWAPNTRYIAPIDPNTIKPAVILGGLRNYLPQFLNMEEQS